LYETVLDGGPELLQQGKVDLAILPKIPPGFSGTAFKRQVRIIPVAHPNHSLHCLQRELTLRDLRDHRHVIVRDTSAQRNTKTYTVDVQQRWTVSNMATSIGAVSRGYGFAWLAEDKIRSELETGVLKELPLRDGRERYAQLYLIHADKDAAGPGVIRLAQIIQEQVERSCAQ
jgi:DNA-binding transcriptional LysR family regulator